MRAWPGSQGWRNPSERAHAFTPTKCSRHSTRLPIFQGRSPSKLDMLMRRWLLLICTAAHYSARE